MDKFTEQELIYKYRRLYDIVEKLERCEPIFDMNQLYDDKGFTCTLCGEWANRKDNFMHKKDCPWDLAVVFISDYMNYN